ncbi:MAG: hypothetical protein CMC15_16720 [Flavobacteriaceae bacterium]|nr:hypothetical protein [Flavobacteriaceae bacterium]
MKKSLINRKQVSEFAKYCADKRAHKFTRVGSDFLDQIDLDVRAAIIARVNQQPSMGKTLRAI